MRKSTVVKSVFGLIAGTLFAIGITAPVEPQTMSAHGQAAASSAMPASTLRVALNRLLAEHVYLAGAATNAALGGRDAEFKAAEGALDGNSVDIGKAVGMVYGPDAEGAFLPLWRRHIGFFVDYTVGVATKDQAKQD